MRLFTEIAGPVDGWSCMSSGVMHSAYQQHKGNTGVLLRDRFRARNDFIYTLVLWHLWVT